MGTRFELALVDEANRSTNDLRAIGELVLGEIDEWHGRLTRFEADSWLAHVNRTAAEVPVQLDDDTMALFADAQIVRRATGGAFDVTRGAGEALVVDASSRTLRFGAPGVAIDLGAIGKGHALDSAAATLRAHGISRAFVHGGTSSGVALGHGPGDGAWRVGVPRSRRASGDADVLELVNSSYSMSDNTSQAAAPGGRHIHDARGRDSDRTALPARRVVVTGPSARLTDAWATALVVVGCVPDGFPRTDGYAARFLSE